MAKRFNTLVRKFYVSAALESLSSLRDVARELSPLEVEKCLMLEANSQRRKAVLDLLMSLAVRHYRRQLKEKYGNPATIHHP